MDEHGEMAVGAWRTISYDDAVAIMEGSEHVGLQVRPGDGGSYTYEGRGEEVADTVRQELPERYALDVAISSAMDKAGSEETYRISIAYFLDEAPLSDGGSRQETGMSGYVTFHGSTTEDVDAYV